MAFTVRTWQQIQTYIKSKIAANSTLSTQLTSTSPVSHWQLWTFIQSLTSNLNEQAGAVLLDEIETVISQGAPQTAPWIQQQIFKFQYNTNTPYLVGINNGVLGYPVTVAADQIISNCAVVATSTGSVRIKVTTGTPPGALNASQLTALNSYLINFLSPNQKYTLISVTGDKLWLAGTVYYNGQLNASIETSVIGALNDYINKFSTSQTSGGSFNGVVKVTDLAQVILGVTGVTDWQPTQITISPATGSPTDLILSSTEYVRLYNTYSGYVIEDPGNPFASTLTFVPSN